VLVAFVGVFPVFGVEPFAHGGLDEAFGFAIGTRRVGSGAVVFDSKPAAG